MLTTNITTVHSVQCTVHTVHSTVHHQLVSPAVSRCLGLGWMVKVTEICCSLLAGLGSGIRLWVSPCRTCTQINMDLGKNT